LQVHTCPQFQKRASTAFSTADSTSASSRTTKGSDPPSSSTDFLIDRAATAATDAPARSLPVSVTAATSGCSMTRAVTSATSDSSTSSVVNSAAGAPTAAAASRKTSCAASAQPVTEGACLSSAVLPAASAGAANRTTCQNGKFHGITASTTPTGSCATQLRAAGVSTSRSARNSGALSA
jgi:hypothetical protein